MPEDGGPPKTNDSSYVGSSPCFRVCRCDSVRTLCPSSCINTVGSLFPHLLSEKRRHANALTR